jgi:hypothetical protein
MTQNSQDRTVQIVADHHDQIVTFARTSYEHAGRGVIQMDFPDVPPETTVRAVRMMRYITLEDLRQIAPPGSPESADLLLRNGDLRSRDTSRGHGVDRRAERDLDQLRLERPNLVDDPGGVQ